MRRDREFRVARFAQTHPHLREFRDDADAKRCAERARDRFRRWRHRQMVGAPMDFVTGNNGSAGVATVLVATRSARLREDRSLLRVVPADRRPAVRP